MASLNKIILIGRLGKDPLAREMQNGGEVVTFGLATSETWKDQSGQKQERTTWHNVVIFNDHIARVAKQYLKKGSQVYLEGSVQNREYEKDGQTHRVSEVVLQKFNGELTMLDSGNNSGNEHHQQGGNTGQGVGNNSGGFDDEIPF
jgi:single-strand DNA-binding protein